MTKWDGIAFSIGFVSSLAVAFIWVRRGYKRDSPDSDVDET